MLHLIAGLYETLYHQEEYKILMIGPANSGKTAIFERMKQIYSCRRSNSKKAASSEETLLRIPVPSTPSDAVNNALNASTVNPSTEKENRQQPPAAAQQNKGSSVSLTSNNHQPPSSSASLQPPPYFSSLRPTIGLNITHLNILGEKVLLWDLGGQVPLRSLWCNYFNQCHAVVLVFDFSDPSTFEDAKSILRDLFLQPSLRETPILILGNKGDQQQSNVGGGQKEGSGIPTTNSIPSESSYVKGGETVSNSSPTTTYYSVSILSTLLDELGLLELATNEEVYRVNSGAAAVSSTTAAAGIHKKNDDQFTPIKPGMVSTQSYMPHHNRWEVLSTVAHTSGIGDRLYRLAVVSAGFDFYVVPSQQQLKKKLVQPTQQPPIEGGAIIMQQSKQSNVVSSLSNQPQRDSKSSAHQEMIPGAITTKSQEGSSSGRMGKEEGCHRMKAQLQSNGCTTLKDAMEWLVGCLKTNARKVETI